MVILSYPDAVAEEPKALTSGSRPEYFVNVNKFVTIANTLSCDSIWVQLNHRCGNV